MARHLKPGLRREPSHQWPVLADKKKNHPLAIRQIILWDEFSHDLPGAPGNDGFLAFPENLAAGG